MPKKGLSPWLPGTWTKDGFLAYADDVLVQTAHKQGIPKLLIYDGVPNKHKHSSYFSGLLVPAPFKTMQPHRISLSTARAEEKRITDNCPSCLSTSPSPSTRAEGRERKETEEQMAELAHAFKESI